MTQIQIIAPSSHLIGVKKTDFQVFESQFLSLNYHFNYSKQVFEKHYFLSGKDNTRLKAFEDSFQNPKINAIWALRGGSGSGRLLDKINYKKIQNNPKPFFGFSDATALQNALFKKCKLPSYTGFLVCFALNTISKTYLKNLTLAMENAPLNYKIKPWTHGKVQGTLVGGNLTAFSSLLGTPYFPDTKEKILILEETNEYPYRLDRMLNTLRLAGVLKNLKGIILGDMTAGLDTQNKKIVRSILHDYFDSASYPVVELPTYSHHNGTAILPIGGNVLINTQKKSLTTQPVQIFKQRRKK